MDQSKKRSNRHQVFYLEMKRSKNMKPSETYSPFTSSRVFITEDNNPLHAGLMFGWLIVLCRLNFP